MGMVPCVAQVIQVANRCVEWRHAFDFGRGIVGQNRCPAIHAGMAQPAFGTRYQAYRRRGATAARQFSDDVVLFALPRQTEFACGKLIRMRKIQK